jgi:hypothetical protein
MRMYALAHLQFLKIQGDPRINRAAINVIEWLDTLPPPAGSTARSVQRKEIMIAGSYCASHNEWVGTCAEYACDAWHPAGK